MFDVREKLSLRFRPRRTIKALVGVLVLALSIYIVATLSHSLWQGSDKDTSPPTRPRGVQAAAISSEKVEVHWSASMDDVGVAGYRIYRCPGDCARWPWPGSFVQVGTSFSGTTFVDSTAEPDTEYTYLVTAYDPTGNESGPGQPPTTGGFRPIMHDHQPHTLPRGYIAQVEVTYPPVVSAGSTFEIRRVHTLRPKMSIGHSDIHYTEDYDLPYRQWAFTSHLPGMEEKVVVTAPHKPGSIFFYTETHLSWPGIIGTDQSPFCSGWYRVVVTNGNAFQIELSSLPAGNAGKPYEHKLSAVGEIAGPFRWGIAHGGSLPSGLSINSQTGIIQGVPQRAGAYSFTAMVEADSGAVSARAFTMSVE